VLAMDIDLKALEDNAMASRPLLLPLAFRWLKENELIPTYKKIEELDPEQAFFDLLHGTVHMGPQKGQKSDVELDHFGSGSGDSSGMNEWRGLPDWTY
jgi:hypothetical protein